MRHTDGETANTSTQVKQREERGLAESFRKLDLDLNNNFEAFLLVVQYGYSKAILVYNFILLTCIMPTNMKIKKLRQSQILQILPAEANT